MSSTSNITISNFTTGTTTFSLGSAALGGYAYVNNPSASIKITAEKLEFVPIDNASPKIVTNKHTIDIDLLYETVQLLAQRLAVLAADEDVLAKHPTLRDAYDQYQILNALLKTNKTE